MKIFVIVMCYVLLASAEVSDGERNTLIKLYEALGGENWEASGQDFSSWTIGDPCVNEWEGISCNGADTRIQRIILSDCNLIGSLPPAEDWDLPYVVAMYVDTLYNTSN
mgnify:CR=1 FL=1